MRRWRPTLALACLPSLAWAQQTLTLTPAQAVQQAVMEAPSLRRERLGTERSERAVRAGAVDFLPVLDLQASYTRLSAIDQPPLVFNGLEIDSPFAPILDNYSTKATVTWPVSDLFLSILPGHRARLDAREVQRATERVERDKVAVNALEAYYGLVRVREGLVVARQGVDVLEAYTTQVDDLFGAGLATRADSLSTQAELQSARAQVLALEGAEQVAEANLLSLMGIEEPVDIALVDWEDVAPNGSWTPAAPDDLTTLALAQRPEAALLTSLVSVYEHTARAQTGAALPHLAVVGNATHANPNQRIIPPTGEFRSTWDATVALTWTPNESFRRGQAAADARVDAEQARTDLVALERGIRVQVTKSLTDLQTAQATEQARQQSVDAADAALEAQRDLLSVGSTTPADTLAAESASRRARHDLVDARIDAFVAHARLQHALGEPLFLSETQP